jgi:hypothetical protein
VTPLSIGITGDEIADRESFEIVSKEYACGRTELTDAPVLEV